MGYEIIINLLTILIMAVAVYYAARLNRSLANAREGRGELMHLIASLTDAQSRAESSIHAMKATAAEYELALQKQIAISRSLVDELSMINDTGNTLATRLERLAPQARSNFEGGSARSVMQEELLRGSPASQNRMPLAAPADLKAGRAQLSNTWSPAPAGQPQRAEIKPVAPATRAGEAVPASVMPRAAAAAAPAASAGSSNEDKNPQSRAEKELFAAIETLRKGGRPT